jgi:hypothetical protein
MRDESKPEEPTAGNPPPTESTEEIEDLEAPAEVQEDLVAGAGCAGTDLFTQI